MALRQHMAVVRVERVDRRGAGERRAGDARAAAVEQDAGAAVARAELRRRVGAGDRRRAGPAAGGRDADQIEQAALALHDDIRRQVGERELADERRNATRLGEGSARAPIALGHRCLPVSSVHLSSPQFTSGRWL